MCHACLPRVSYVVCHQDILEREGFLGFGWDAESRGRRVKCVCLRPRGEDDQNKTTLTLTVPSEVPFRLNLCTNLATYVFVVPVWSGFGPAVRRRRRVGDVGRSGCWGLLFSFGFCYRRRRRGSGTEVSGVRSRQTVFHCRQNMWARHSSPGACVRAYDRHDNDRKMSVLMATAAAARTMA